MSQQIKKQSKQFDEYECGNGPRPPVPGEESQVSKMTTEGASGTSNSSRSPEVEDAFTKRVTKWQENLEFLLADTEGLALLRKFVKEELGEDSIHSKRWDFYFVCEGLKTNMPAARRIIRAVHDKYIAKNSIDLPQEFHTTYVPELSKTVLQISRKEIQPILNIYDEVQKCVEKIMAHTIYPTFLQSDIFIQYIEQNTKDSTINATSTSTTSTQFSTLAGAAAQSSSDGNATAVATSSRMTIDTSPLIATSNLQTLHEDLELKLSDVAASSKTTTDRPMPKLTKDLLLATQKGRLEVRPQGAHGYTYSVPLNSSYNPVSRQDSERQSCSSASLTDSEMNSKDGKPYFPRRPTAAENYRKCYINPSVQSQRTALKPFAQGLREAVQPPARPLAQGLREAVPPPARPLANRPAFELNPDVLTVKLNALKQEMENVVKQERFSQSLSDKLSSAQPRVFPAVEDDDQSILDQHVSRVFSPYLSPGTISPKILQRYHHRANEMSTSMPDFALRHSKSIPEHASSGLFSSTTKRSGSGLPHRWPSTNIDSGISLYSADIQPYPKTKEPKSNDQFADETMRRSMKDESRRGRKTATSQQTLGHQSNLMPTSSSHHTNSLPRQHEPCDHQDFTYAVYIFEDEKLPFRTKLPSKRPTLKHFKDFSPKKGNFRFFFTTTCSDLDNMTIQEEVTNDADPLPLYEGKVMGTLKSE